VTAPKLSLVQQPGAARASAPAGDAAKLDALREVLLREAQLATELRDELLRQRAAVAAADTAAVDRGSDALSRVLLGLDEARRRRGELLEALTGDANVPLDRLEAQFGGALPPALESARRTLRRAATDAAREATINRGVLRRAVDAGEAFLQDLFSGGAPQAPTYGATPTAPTPPPAGRILDRTA